MVTVTSNGLKKKSNTGLMLTHLTSVTSALCFLFAGYEWAV